MTFVPVVADRVRKARRESTCPACSGPILVGQQIARCSGRLWWHASCFIAEGGHRHHADGSCPGNRTEDVLPGNPAR